MRELAMRRIILIFVLTVLLPTSVVASDVNFILPEFSDIHEKHLQNNLSLKRLSLTDLENIMTPDSKQNQEIQFNTNEPSTIEDLYSSRVIDDLEQYGYDLFQDNTNRTSPTIPAGTVQDNYILSTGDSLSIIMRGQTNSHQTYEIDSQGLLIVENLAPVNAAGRSLKSVKKELESAVTTLHNTQLFVSLAETRQIGVLVVGHVHKPGRQNLTAFNTVLDALSAAGGIQKTGSMRRIKLVRHSNSYAIDLYQLLMASTTGADRLLKDGDRIVVPPIGATMAISGSVKRPAIYEIREGESISTHQALGLAGGVLTPGQHRYLKMEYTQSGEEVITDIQQPADRVFGDGAILNVTASKQKRSSAVTLTGHTRQPGTHDLKKSRTLSDLINDEKVLGKDIYPLIGIIQRTDKNEFTKKLIAFSPSQILKGGFDKELSDGDTVQLFSSMQIQSLQHDTPLYHSVASNRGDMIVDPVLVTFLKERSVFVRGAVRQAGAYPVSDNANLKNILAVAGGLSLEANPENIEITSRENGRQIINSSIEQPISITIHAGDTVRVNQKFHKIATKTVAIKGEVNHPGNYDLTPGDTLLDLINRAGGLTPQAYADGTIFSRATERMREEKRYKAQAQDLELKLERSMQQVADDKKPNMTQIDATQNLITQLKDATAIGRITVEADPVILSTYQDQNILLEKGDRIYIPQRPLTVRVAGEVLSPAALQFRDEKAPLDYIREAGGTTHFADKSRTFVIYPDGSAQPLKVSGWNHNSVKIPPGSTIIVPRDPKPFDFIESATQVSQIIANLAISGLYIEAIGDE